MRGAFGKHSTNIFRPCSGQGRLKRCFSFTNRQAGELRPRAAGRRQAFSRQLNGFNVAIVALLFRLSTLLWTKALAERDSGLCRHVDKTTITEEIDFRLCRGRQGTSPCQDRASRTIHVCICRVVTGPALTNSIRQTTAISVPGAGSFHGQGIGVIAGRSSALHVVCSLHHNQFQSLPLRWHQVVRVVVKDGHRLLSTDGNFPPCHPPLSLFVRHNILSHRYRGNCTILTS